jgi:hypothetical protein
MAIGGKGGKGKPKRGVERVFTEPLELERQNKINNREMPSSESEESETEEQNSAPIIEISNPNRQQGKNTMKLKDLTLDDKEEKPELSRRERYLSLIKEKLWKERESRRIF